MSFRMYLVLCAVFLAVGILLAELEAAAVPARDMGPHLPAATEQVPVLSDDSIPSCRQLLHDLHEKHDLAGDKLLGLTDVNGGGVEITYLAKRAQTVLRYLLVLDVRVVRTSLAAIAHCDIKTQTGLKMRASLYSWAVPAGAPQ